MPLGPASSALAFIRDPVAFAIDGPESRQWRIRSLDETFELEIEGEFRPRDGLSLDVASDIATAGGAGDLSEMVQFIRGRADRVSVTVELHSARPGLFGAFADDIESELAQLELLPRRHPDLRRPPICRFTWGQFTRRVMFTSASIAVKRLHPNGNYAEVAVALSMVQVQPLSVEIAEPGLPPPESTEVIIQPGETCEMLAARFYGDPLKGVNLRLRHPDLVAGIETAGTRILVVNRDHPDIVAETVFVSPALQPGDEFDELFRDFLIARSGARVFPN